MKVTDSVARVPRFSPSETAMFVFSLKQPLLNELQRRVKSAEDLGRVDQHVFSLSAAWAWAAAMR